MKIAVMGTAQSAYSESSAGKNYGELAFDVVETLLARSAVAFDIVDCTVSASSDFTDGRTISDMAIQDAVRGVDKPESKVSMDGAFAVAQAAMRILSGQFETALVIAHAKPSECDFQAVTGAAFDPIYARLLHPTQEVACALQASALLALQPKASELSVKLAAVALGKTESQVRDSTLLASPLRENEFAALRDGACAVLLASEKAVARFPKKPIAWLTGFGYATEAHSLGARDLTDPISLKAASQRAFSMASIDLPTKQIDRIEQTAFTSYQESLFLEAMGFADRGMGFLRYLEGGVNDTGGALRAHPDFASGLARFCDAAELIATQKAGRALAHGSYGIAAQSHAVLVLERN